MQKQSEKGAKPQQKVTGPILKKERVPAKLLVDQKSDLKFVTGGGPLKDSFVIVIGGKNTLRQYTVHHPIGVTDLDGFDWIITRSDEVQSLMQRIKDPDAPRLNQLRSELLTDYAVSQSLLKKDKEGNLLYPQTMERRDKVLGDARKHVDKDFEKTSKAWEKLKESKGSSALKPKKKDPIDYVEGENRSDELKLREYWKQPITQAAVDKEYPTVYRTRSGPLRNEDQKRINGKNKFLTLNEAEDLTVSVICTMAFAGGHNPPVKQPSSGPHDEETEEEEEEEEVKASTPAPVVT
jgi:hypothetical protein